LGEIVDQEIHQFELVLRRDGCLTCSAWADAQEHFWASFL
jgi:hypothetical protein